MPAGTLFLVGPPKPDRPEERGQTKRDKLVLQEWGFCGWVGIPPEEKQSTQKQRRTALDTDGLNGKDGNASMPEQVKRPNPWKKMIIIIIIIIIVTH
jgi:hypothetical protein